MNVRGTSGSMFANLLRAREEGALCMRFFLPFVALSANAAIVVIPSSQPDYPPQVQPPYTLTVPFEDLSREFPQVDFSGSNGLICSFVLNPAHQPVCTTPAVDWVAPTGPFILSSSQPAAPSPIPEPRLLLAGALLLLSVARRLRR